MHEPDLRFHLFLLLLAIVLVVLDLVVLLVDAVAVSPCLLRRLTRLKQSTCGGPYC